MKSSEKVENKKSKSATTKKVISFSEGLPAFEFVKEFYLITNEEEAPFLWLQAAKVPNLAFITIDPFLIYPDYKPDICDNEIKKLGIEQESDALILSIVTIHPNTQQLTANLVSPILINWKKQTARQVILNNHRNYSVYYRIDNLQLDDDGNVMDQQEE